MAQINGRESLLYLKLTERQEQTKKQVNFIRFINPKKYGIFSNKCKKYSFYIVSWIQWSVLTRKHRIK